MLISFFTVEAERQSPRGMTVSRNAAGLVAETVNRFARNDGSGKQFSRRHEASVIIAKANRTASLDLDLDLDLDLINKHAKATKSNLTNLTNWEEYFDLRRILTARLNVSSNAGDWLGNLLVHA